MSRSRAVIARCVLLTVLCLAMATPAGAEAGTIPRPTGLTSDLSSRAGQAGDLAPAALDPAAAFNGLTPARLLDTRSSGVTIDGIGDRGGAFVGTRTFR
ncbi:MAG: hypothetical protein WBF71_06650 [Microthrixaceae bacterium]